MRTQEAKKTVIIRARGEYAESDPLIRCLRVCEGNWETEDMSVSLKHARQYALYASNPANIRDGRTSIGRSDSSLEVSRFPPSAFHQQTITFTLRFSFANKLAVSSIIKTSDKVNFIQVGPRSSHQYIYFNVAYEKLLD